MGDDVTRARGIEIEYLGHHGRLCLFFFFFPFSFICFFSWCLLLRICFPINWFEFRVQVRSTGFGPLRLVNHGVIFLFLSNFAVFLDSFVWLGSADRWVSLVGWTRMKFLVIERVFSVMSFGLFSG